MGWVRRLSTIAVLGALSGVVYVALTADSSQRQAMGRRAGDRQQPVPVNVSTARLADVPVTLEGVGTARPRNSITVRPQVDGRIIGLDFKEGQDVKRGDVLARIDPALYQAQLDQAIAKKALDEAQLSNARKDMERYSALTSNAVSAKTVDTQRALVAQLEAQVKADEAAISSARTTLQFTTIVSPIDGRAGIRAIDVGNLVRAGDAGIVVITEVRPIVVLFTLPQQQLPQVNAALAKGPVMVEALGADGKAIIDTGTLEAVDNMVDQATGTIRMKAEFQNANLQLWPGQFVNVRVRVDTLQQVVVIPSMAVQRGPKGTIAFVLTDDNKVAVRDIVVAQQTEMDAVIKSGIAAADQIVTAGFARLSDGSRVTTDELGPPVARKPAGVDTPSAALFKTEKVEPGQDGKSKHRGDGVKRGEGHGKRSNAAAEKPHAGATGGNGADATPTTSEPASLTTGSIRRESKAAGGAVQ